MSEEKYFNFPVQLLGGFMVDSQKVLNDIVAYCIYEHYHKLEFGTEKEMIKACEDYFSLTLGNGKKSLIIGEELHNSLPINSPRVGLKLTTFWQFFKEDKTDFEKACLLAFLGLKSIVGDKAYSKVTNGYLWARMDGKIKAVNDVFQLSKEVRVFANRYQTEKIKYELIFNWGLTHYSRFTRGFFVSFKMKLEDLVYEVEKKRISAKKKQQKEIQKEVLNKAKERLKNTPP